MSKYKEKLVLLAKSFSNIKKYYIMGDRKISFNEFPLSAKKEAGEKTSEKSEEKESNQNENGVFGLLIGLKNWRQKL